MAFRLLTPDGVGAEVSSIVRAEAEQAYATLADPLRLGAHESVHSARKRLKRARAGVRLIRPGIGEIYTESNRAFRDAGRAISELRDAKALTETVDDIAGAVEHPPEALLGVRAVLARRADEASTAVTASFDALAEARHEIERGLEAVAHIGEVGHDDLVAGIGKTYGRASGRLTDAIAEPSDQALHEWRKRVKYLWNQVKLLREAAPSVLVPYSKRLHDLSDALGDDHDLAVLSHTVRSEPDLFGGVSGVHTLDATIAGLRADLQDRAIGLGMRLLAEGTSEFEDRIAALIEAWRIAGPERAAGEISAVYPVHQPLAGRTRDQLYAQARRLDIAGRSAMTRDELALAVRSAE